MCEAAEVACEDVLEHEQTGALPSTGAQSTVAGVSWHAQRVSFQMRECELVNHSGVTSYEHCMLLCCYLFFLSPYSDSSSHTWACTSWSAHHVVPEAYAAETLAFRRKIV